MSKAVRIRDHLYAEIAALAKSERRSLIAQLEVLLEQALKLNAGYPDLATHIESSGAAVGDSAVTGSAPPDIASPGEPVRSAPDSHFDQLGKDLDDG